MISYYYSTLTNSYQVYLPNYFLVSFFLCCSFWHIRSIYSYVFWICPLCFRLVVFWSFVLKAAVGMFWFSEVLHVGLDLRRRSGVSRYRRSSFRWTACSEVEVVGIRSCPCDAWSCSRCRICSFLVPICFTIPACSSALKKSSYHFIWVCSLSLPDFHLSIITSKFDHGFQACQSRTHLTGICNDCYTFDCFRLRGFLLCIFLCCPRLLSFPMVSSWNSCCCHYMADRMFGQVRILLKRSHPWQTRSDLYSDLDNWLLWLCSWPEHLSNLDCLHRRFLADHDRRSHLL